MEYLIKLVIWWVSWMGGVAVLFGESNGISSTFLVFSLSILMEFAPKIKGKKHIVSRIIHGLFCASELVVFLSSMYFLLENSYNTKWHSIMNGVTLSTLIYMTIDFVLLWVINESCIDNVVPPVEDIRPESEIFNKSLQSGALGNLKKDEE